jgi:hypothetical protein
MGVNRHVKLTLCGGGEQGLLEALRRAAACQPGDSPHLDTPTPPSLAEMAVTIRASLLGPSRAYACTRGRTTGPAAPSEESRASRRPRSESQQLYDSVMASSERLGAASGAGMRRGVACALGRFHMAHATSRMHACAPPPRELGA